jgi:hypothetical protein
MSDHHRARSSGVPEVVVHIDCALLTWLQRPGRPPGIAGIAHRIVRVGDHNAADRKWRGTLVAQRYRVVRLLRRIKNENCWRKT